MQALGERAKKSPDLCSLAVSGATLSSLATILQLTILLTAISTTTLNALKWSLIFGGISIAAYGLIITMLSLHQQSIQSERPKEAFSLKSALLFALMMAVVLIVSAALKAWFGQNGLIIASGLAGLADTHAPSITVASMVATGKISAEKCSGAYFSGTHI